MKKFALLSIFLILPIFLASCDNDCPVDNHQDTYSMVSVEELSILEADLSSDITESEEFNFEQEYDFEAENFANTRFIPLNEILRKLELTDRQLPAVKRYLQANQDCVRSILMRLSLAQRTLFADYRSRYQRILQAVNNGTMTRAQAARHINQLRQELRRKMMELRYKACVAISDCRNELLRNIYSILNEEQKAMFERWLNSLSKFDCGRPADNGRS